MGDVKNKKTGETQRDEHAVINDIAGKKVFVIDSKGNLVDFSGESDLAINIQVDSGDSNLTYVGLAQPGTITSAATWQVFRINETTGTIIKWADGNDSFDNIFDNRESLSYS